MKTLLLALLLGFSSITLAVAGAVSPAESLLSRFVAQQYIGAGLLLFGSVVVIGGVYVLVKATRMISEETTYEELDLDNY